MLTESDIRSVIDGEGGFNMYNSAPGIFGKRSSGGGSFDFSMGGGMRKYMRSKKKEDKIDSSLYIAEGDNYAHNRMNFGYFLWGATGYTLWYSQKQLLKAADLNSRFGIRNGYSGVPDSDDDQLSITKGTEYAKKNFYCYKVEHTWIGKLLEL